MLQSLLGIITLLLVLPVDCVYLHLLPSALIKFGVYEVPCTVKNQNYEGSAGATTR